MYTLKIINLDNPKDRRELINFKDFKCFEIAQLEHFFDNTLINIINQDNDNIIYSEIIKL